VQGRWRDVLWRCAAYIAVGALTLPVIQIARDPLGLKMAVRRLKRRLRRPAETWWRVLAATDTLMIVHRQQNGWTAW